jgi:hypothetical protein
MRPSFSCAITFERSILLRANPNRLIFGLCFSHGPPSHRGDLSLSPRLCKARRSAAAKQTFTAKSAETCRQTQRYICSLNSPVYLTSPTLEISCSDWRISCSFVEIQGQLLTTWNVLPVLLGK